MTQLCDTLTTNDAKLLGSLLYAKKILAGFLFGKYQILTIVSPMIVQPWDNKYDFRVLTSPL